MRPKNTFVIIITLLVAMPVLAFAQSGTENFTWMVWERRALDPVLCRSKGVCTPQRTFITRLLEQPSDQSMLNMIGAVDQIARMRGLPVENPEAPKMCRQTEAAKILGFNPETWPLSDKLAALKGLQGVYFSVQSLKGPKGYNGKFGANLQKQMEMRFRVARLPVLTEDQMERTPGKPQLNIYFSNSKPKTGCTYSVFVSFTQTMLLTRNHTVKLKVGTWGASGGPSADFPSGTEMDAILRVIDKFLGDYKRANSS
jgi:hypothetical protein